MAVWIWQQKHQILRLVCQLDVDNAANRFITTEWFDCLNVVNHSIYSHSYFDVHLEFRFPFNVSTTVLWSVVCARNNFSAIYCRNSTTNKVFARLHACWTAKNRLRHHHNLHHRHYYFIFRCCFWFFFVAIFISIFVSFISQINIIQIII